MTQSEVYESPVDGGPARVEAASEAAYHDAWVEHALPREPDLLAMAISGGLIADRLAWVFVRGLSGRMPTCVPHSDSAVMGLLRGDRGP